MESVTTRLGQLAILPLCNLLDLFFFSKQIFPFSPISFGRFIYLFLSLVSELSAINTSGTSKVPSAWRNPLELGFSFSRSLGNRSIPIDIIYLGNGIC